MIVRILEPNELYKSALISAVAFEMGFDYQKASAEARGMTAEDIAAAKRRAVERGVTLPSGEYPDVVTWGAMSAEGELYGSMKIVTHLARFDGHTVLLGGVGDVSTLPQHRRQGSIRACMNAALNDMFEKDYAFSFLYPFSRAYYRKFGYENGGAASTWTIPFSALKLPDVAGTVEMLAPGDDLSPLCEVYNRAFAEVNLSVARRAYDTRLAEENWLQDKRYIYLWRDPTGAARGLMQFRKIDRVLDCTTTFANKGNLMFTDAEALTALLRFAGTAFAADYDGIRFTVPQGVRIDGLISEGNAARCEVASNGMLRIVNVKRALELCACKGAGALTLSVIDPIIRENNGAWRIAYAEGSANAVERCDAAADVEMPIGELSMLLSGVREARDIPFMPNVRVNRADAPLEDLFYYKKCHMLDLF